MKVRYLTRLALSGFGAAALFLMAGCGNKNARDNGLCTDPFLHTYTSAKGEVDAFKASVAKDPETNFENLKRLETAKKLQTKLDDLVEKSRSDSTYCRMANDDVYRSPYGYFWDLKVWVDNYVWNWK